MHKKKVVDLQNYRDEEVAQEPASHPYDQNLRPGTGLLFGQYTISNQINAGGFGITYLAKDSLGRNVAIKECFPSELCERAGNEMRPRSLSYKTELDDIVGHFLTEAQRLAALKHKSIVHVHQIFEENATAYMVMDYIEGSDLLDLIDASSDGASITPASIEALTRDVLQAIAYVHGQGILHRDLAPDNIMVRQNNEPVLIDFGTAKRLSDKESARPSLLKFVKDGYSPQEFYVSGHAQGPSSDLYSFGATLHHIISGTPPEDAQTRLAAVMAGEPDPYLPLARRFEGFSPRFLSSIDAALEVLPEDRIQQADDWLALIRRSWRNRGVPRLATIAIENLSATLVSGPAANNPKLVKGAVAALAVLIVTAVGLAGFGGKDHVGDFAAAPVIAGDAPDQPFIELATIEPTSSLGEIAPVDTVVLRWVPVPAPIENDATPAAVVDIAKINVAVSDNIATQVPPAIDQDILTGFASEAALPTFSDVAALPEIRDISNDGPRLIGQAPVAAAPPAIDTVYTASIQTADADIAPLAAPLKPLVPIAIDTQNVDFGRPAPLPEVTLVSSFVDLAAPALPEETVLNWEDHASVPVISDAAELPVIFSEKLFDGDVTPPASLEKLTAVLKIQIVYSNWFAEMPFASRFEKGRNANTATISRVNENANLEVSGNWIKEGVVIYSFNGKTLKPDTPISGHVLNDMNIDPDGYARASVRYRDPDTGNVGRGLLAVPIVRRIGLIDGSRIVARVVDQEWTLTVDKAAPGSGFEVGDTLFSETTTGLALNAHQSLASVLRRLVAENAKAATFTVSRDGQTRQVPWTLARAN